MIVKNISYTNFRNIEGARISFDPGINLLYGDNAQGKTNALEGVYLFARGRSHRTAKEKDFILHGRDFACLTLEFEDVRRTQRLDVRYLRSGRKFLKKNGMPVKKSSEFIGNFRAVIFCPEYLSIVRDGPSERRAFMDGGLCQLDPVYLAALQKYNCALMQRNKLLANCRFDPNPFLLTGELWAEQMAQSGEIISFKRAEYMEQIEKEVKTLFFEMTAGAEEPTLCYKSPKKAEEFMALFESAKEREMKNGCTLVGVHKDDVEILLDGRPARIFGSQGQQRSIAVAMKLAEGSISAKITGEYPVFLLDDVLSELDDKRKRFVLSGLEGRQVIITCCDEKDAERIAGGRVIRVEKGQYQTVF